MEEIIELIDTLKKGNVDDALAIALELEEMSRDDKVNKIRSFSKILLIHLIKKAAEKRTTRSWEYSIYNAINEIVHINKRRKAGGVYLDVDELREIVHEIYPVAMKKASLEAFEGQYSEKELNDMADRDQIERQALSAIENEMDRKADN